MAVMFQYYIGITFNCSSGLTQIKFSRKLQVFVVLFYSIPIARRSWLLFKLKEILL
ncbi:hypothetical protein MtrunA17_Chr2g0299441 [Medicago truncatula]|uniref:Uncharacterized protein n=1 Tax=Medicago truncatula TaxID=3880 RepID=A0A396JAP4_MEDTR|nr:hypothetical protein MtrunA17_Chr2g0299441 [Medicago truncatula]